MLLVNTTAATDRLRCASVKVRHGFEVEVVAANAGEWKERAKTAELVIEQFIATLEAPGSDPGALRERLGEIAEAWRGGDQAVDQLLERRRAEQTARSVGCPVEEVLVVERLCFDEPQAVERIISRTAEESGTALTAKQAEAALAALAGQGLAERKGAGWIARA